MSDSVCQEKLCKLSFVQILKNIQIFDIKRDAPNEPLTYPWNVCLLHLHHCSFLGRISNHQDLVILSSVSFSSCEATSGSKALEVTFVSTVQKNDTESA